LNLPALRALTIPLRLVWNRRQAAVRPILPRLGESLAAALATDG
jgi:hypothetical protein